MIPNDLDEIPDDDDFDTYCEDPNCEVCNPWDDYFDCEEDSTEPCMDDDCPFCP